jgi:hypothetical protein
VADCDLFLSAVRFVPVVLMLIAKLLNKIGEQDILTLVEVGILQVDFSLGGRIISG